MSLRELEWKKWNGGFKTRDCFEGELRAIELRESRIQATAWIGVQVRLESRRETLKGS